VSDHGQIEIYSLGSTHTIYEWCGFDECRERILKLGLQIPGDIFGEDEFVVTGTDRVTSIITVRNSLDESDSCVWCFGCGDFLRHANAGTPCDCDERGHDPSEDREPMKPLVMENGRLELTPFD
jgi:hypothetical protein